MSNREQPEPISRQTLKRLPDYLAYMKSDGCAGMESVSAGRIAQALGQSEIQVRKDLAAVSTKGGKPKKGFDRQALISDINVLLGLDNVDYAVLVGVGSLGTALLHYDGMKDCGVEIVAAFDIRGGREEGGVMVLEESELIPICRRLNVHIGVVAVPAQAAQGVAEDLVEGGVLAIWNFAPVRLELPESIIVQNENIAHSLTMLSHKLAQRFEREGI